MAMFGEGNKQNIYEELKDFFDNGGTFTLKRINMIADILTNLQEKCENYRKLKERYQIEKGFYKQRNEKAIEYIHNHQPVFELSSKEQIQQWFEKEFYVNLLNILKGDKDE